jgi:tRNA pseudouridine55 synthase
MDGVLVVDKPSGPTSHDVVTRVRAALDERRIGHTGTLDPLATGVLPLVIGRATRLAQFLSGSDKTYEATVRLGLVTDTYDVAGRVVSQQQVDPSAIDPESVERALDAIRGSRLQAPPPYSAKKIGGARAYDLARRAQPVALDPVPVTIHDLRLNGIESDSLHLTVTASAGFYVRTLAHEVGAALGTGGCLAALRRTRSGDYDLATAIPLEDVVRNPPLAAGRLIPLDRLLPALPHARLTPSGCHRALHGAAIRLEDLAEPRERLSGEFARLLDADGHLRAIARSSRDGSALHPLVVLG